VLQYGPPETILTDQGTHFVNKLIEQVTEYLQTRHLRTTPYHPQTNGMTERFNGTLCKALSKLAQYSDDDWDKFVPTVLFSYRIRKHTTLGKSPYEALYGKAPRLPSGEIIGIPTPVKERIQNLREIQNGAKRPSISKKSKFHNGQRVLWKSGLRRNKMEPNLYGPYTIQASGPNNTYILANDDGTEVPILISGDRLQLHKERTRNAGRRAVVPTIVND
jgi:transposase InsO family protein